MQRLKTQHALPPYPHIILIVLDVFSYLSANTDCENPFLLMLKLNNLSLSHWKTISRDQYLFLSVEMYFKKHCLEKQTSFCQWKTGKFL